MAIPKADGIRRSDFEGAEVRKHTSGRFVVTAACAGARVSRPFLNSLENYCRRQKATLIILPMRGHGVSAEGEFFDTVLHPYMERGQMVGEYIFNKNLRAADFYLNPQQIQTLTGLERFNDTSLIVAHTKMFLKHHAVGNNGVPRSVHSTGVCTLPNYHGNRIGALADRDHTVGALVVEIDGDVFYQRQLTAAKDGSVVDLGERFLPNGETKTAICTALVLGDVHAGQHCWDALNFAEGLSRLLSPNLTVLHDLFNGLSISHHAQHKKLDRLKTPEAVDTLGKELAVTAGVLQHVQAWGSQVAVVASNHNDWLTRYLNETSRWAHDSPKAILEAARLYVAVGDDLTDNPLQYAIDQQKACLWWDRETDYRVDGIQLASHGDLGVNGGYGSGDALERAHGDATVGHTHSAGIYRGIYWAGHSTHPRHGYNKGASTWTKSHVLQYAGGQRQIVTLIKGKWRS